MKTRILGALALAGALLFLGQAAHAQTQTNVTATVVDPLGIPYANGTYSIQLIPTGTNPTVNGNSISGAFNGSTDATGSFNVALWPNASIVPAATTWQFTVCTNPGGVAPPLGTGNQCTPPTVVTIAGASQSLSATLSAVAPRLTLIGSGGTGPVKGCTAPAANSAIAFQDGVTNQLTCSPNFVYSLNSASVSLDGQASFCEFAPGPNGNGEMGCQSTTGNDALFIFNPTNHLIQTENEGLLGFGGFSMNTVTGETCWFGVTSGKACIAAQSVAGTPNQIDLPTATGAAGTFLESDGGNPQQLSWVAVGGGAVTGTAGQTLYVSGVNAATGTSVTRDMLGEAGADLGAKMNNCATNLPAAGGICKGDNLAASTLSTAVTTAKAVVYTFCGQAISQTAAVTLNAANSAIEGCPGKKTTFTKAGNIDQITLSAANVSVRGITLAGVKASFTGNGIITAAGATQAVIENNVISGEAGDAIKDNSGTFSVNLIRGNVLSAWGLHGFESTNSTQKSIFSGNYMAGDGTATGTGILNAGSSGIIGNFLKWADSSQILFDDSTAAQSHVVTGNSINNTGTATAFKFGLNTVATGNTISQSGGTNSAVSGQGIFSSNFVQSTNADALDLVAGASIAENNTISMSMNGVSNKCAINSSGDQINVRIANNRISVGDAAADTNSAICDTPTGGHNLSVVIDGNTIDTTGVGGSAVNGIFVNNAAGLNTNWAVIVQNNSCVHLGGGTCQKRVDAQNNKSVYINNLPGDSTLDAGTGSTNDVLKFDTQNFTFATLPTPIGNGSQFYCTDCSQTKPTAALGGGAWVVREAGANNGL